MIKNGSNLRRPREVDTYYSQKHLRHHDGCSVEVFLGFAAVWAVSSASLTNMREQVADILGSDYSSSLLPRWMNSQQDNGVILGFIQAWVICYTQPGKSEIGSAGILESRMGAQAPFATGVPRAPRAPGAPKKDDYFDLLLFGINHSYHL